MVVHNPSKKSPKAKEYANRSVLIGAGLLRTISKLGGAASLPEIAEANGMLVARTHRYLISLVKSGLADYDPLSGRYALGALVLELGLTALERLDAVRLGSDAVRRLADTLDLTAMLSCWGSNGATIIKCEMTRHHRINQRREGMNLPLLSSATGRIFLAYLPRRETQDFLKDQTIAGASSATEEVMSPGEIEALRVDIRRRGIARNSGDTNRDALAAPVFNFEGKLVMVITVVADVKTMDMELDSEAARALIEMADDLSRQLGAGANRNRASTAA